jgi:hypothetical protein
MKSAERTERVRELNADPPINDRSLSWQVACGGYEWMTVGGQQSEWVTIGGQRVMTECAVSRALSQPRTREYVTADGAVLFEKFAGLRPTEGDFKKFANEFGVLGVGRPGDGMIDATVPVGGKVIGETYWAWKLVHRDIADAWRLWKSPRGNPSTKKDRLAAMVNDALDGHVVTRVVLDTRRGSHVLRSRPATLLGCLWMGFARKTLTGDLRFRKCRCRTCDNLVEIGKDARTASAEFCSDKCRVRDYRERLQQRDQETRRAKNKGRANKKGGR